MTLKIYLIRHGETDFNRKSMEYGQSDETSLNKRGLEQVKKLSLRLKYIRVDKIFSSQVRRAIQTAEVLSKYLRIPVIKDERLKEYEPGKVDPSSEEWSKEYKRMLNEGMSKYDIRPFGGENIWDLIKRAKSFLEEIEKEKGTIVIISHSGFNEVFINLSQKREKDDFVHLKQDNTSINILERDKKKWCVKVINDSSHISKFLPTVTLYNNQEKIKSEVREHILKELDNLCTKIFLRGEIVSGKIGSYDRPYKRYEGSPIEVFAKMKEGFLIPKKWKISKLYNGVKKYEIGKIKINEIKHKINLTILSDRCTKEIKLDVLK